MNVAFMRESDVGIQETDGGFKTSVYPATDASDIDLETMKDDFDIMDLDRFTNIGSGWTLQSIDKLIVHIERYRPFVGNSYIPTP
jgi:hypothetical protein